MATGVAAGSPRLEFAKGHGTGNDFILLPDPAGHLELTADLAVALCDRRTGLGADGVLRVARGDDGIWFMDHRNADGSPAEMCGNGIRVFARYVVDRGWERPGRLHIRTRGGPRTVEVTPNGPVSVDMGPPGRDPLPRVVTVGGLDLPGTAVSMGNPHVVAPVEALTVLDSLDLTVAPRVDPVFPTGVNVELVVLTGRRSLRMRVHERGVGETASCGTGACAAAVAAADWAHDDGPWVWDVQVPGGRLSVRWTGSTVILSGPAVLLAEGTVAVAALPVIPG